MVQDFHVVRCFSCQSFQVQQEQRKNALCDFKNMLDGSPAPLIIHLQTTRPMKVKKVKKWLCKLCGQKQSLLKEFGRGSGADCRRHVQKLNAMRGAMMEEEHCTWASRAQLDEEEEEEVAKEVSLGSRWSKYLNACEEAEPESPQQEEAGSEARKQLCSSRKRRAEELPHTGGGGGDEDSQLIGPAVRRSADEAHFHPSAFGSDCSLRSDSQIQEEEPPDCGRGQAPNRPRPGLIASSLFETEEDFSIDF